MTEGPRYLEGAQRVGGVLPWALDCEWRLLAMVDGPAGVGQRLRTLRLERGLSQRQLASPGVSYAYISRIEAGLRRPSVKALRQLAPKLGVSVHWLETGKDDPATELARLVLARDEKPLPRSARALARRVLGDST